MADEPTLWGIVGGGGGLTVGAVLLGIWDRYFRRKEKVEDNQKSDREHMLTYLDERGKDVLDRQDREIARLEDGLTKERARNDALEKRLDEEMAEKDGVYDIARQWKTRADYLRHDLAGARSEINMHRVALAKPEMNWPDEALPPLEGIAADNVRRQTAKAAWRAGVEE